MERSNKGRKFLISYILSFNRFLYILANVKIAKCESI